MKLIIARFATLVMGIELPKKTMITDNDTSINEKLSEILNS